MSRMTTSGRWRVSSSNPSAPDEAVYRVTSGSRKARRNAWRMDALSSITSRLGMAPPRHVGLCSRRCPRPSDRQAEDEAGPALRRVGDPEAAAVALGDAPRHGQAQAEAGLLAADERL